MYNLNKIFNTPYTSASPNQQQRYKIRNVTEFKIGHWLLNYISVLSIYAMADGMFMEWALGSSVDY